MPEGVGYEVHEGGSPPSAGQIRAAGGNGVLWKRPDGSVFLALGPADFRQASPEQVEYANRPPVEEQLPAEEQAAAVEGAPPAPVVGETGGGATEAIRARFTSGAARAAEQERAGTESAVQAEAARQRRIESDPYFGIDIGERGEVALIMRDEGLDELSAIEEYKKRRGAAEAGALEQAEAIEGAEVPPR